jgi:hypothetical protein
MQTIQRWAPLSILLLLILALVACQSYSQTGATTSSQRDMNGGQERAAVRTANGTSTRQLEDLPNAGGWLDADVTLSVEKGSFKIELLGENDEVTLTLEARDGQAVSASGAMAVDSFGEASYRITAVEAENAEYTIVYVYR